MRTFTGLTLALLGLGTAFAACAKGGDTSETTTPTGTATGTTDVGGGGSGTTTTTTGGNGGSGAQGGQPEDPCVVGADHLLISEVATGPVTHEFIEIWNPGSTAVDLTHYFLSDNSVYYKIAYGQAWDPETSVAGTDFLAQFPAGASIGAGQVLVVQAGSGDFRSTFSECPDYVMANSPRPCGSTSVPPLVAPQNGGIGDQAGTLLSNDREMVVLFCWGGQTSTVKDVDYVTWGDDYSGPWRIDKSGEAGYEADRPVASQQPAFAALETNSIARCDEEESAETTSGGNGISGHDETSENMGASFAVLCTPNPGEQSCNGAGGCGGGGG